MSFGCQEQRNPLQVGEARYRIVFAKYAANSSIYIDHALYGAASGTMLGGWLGGQSVIYPAASAGSGGMVAQPKVSVIGGW